MNDLEVLRERIENCWIELESANTWDEINRISNRLERYGSEYQQQLHSKARENNPVGE